MNRSYDMSRRTMLRGVGTAMALPLLDVMKTARAGTPTALPASAGMPARHPNRMVYLFVPNGKVMEDWTPATEGADYEITPSLEPLADLREDFSILSGLAHRNGLALGDGPGDHARASASFLTAAHPYKTGGRGVKLGQSVDQFAAEQIGRNTRLPSLELGCEKSFNAGVCDSGYSCIYTQNISWRTEFMPTAKEVNPRLVFERLFGGDATAPTDEAGRRRFQYRKSVLDLVREDAASLRKRLGGEDKRKIDEYFTAVRDIELRIERLLYVRGDEDDAPMPELDKPDGVPSDYKEHLRLMYDLMTVAMQTDATRIYTFMLAHAGNNRPYRELDVKDGHHHLSHHGGDKAKIDALRKINLFHVKELARFLKRLKETPEGEGSLLDHSMICYGSGLGDGNRHSHLDLPVLLAGKGNGTLTPGRHIRYPKETPMANLFLSMLDRMGVETEAFGDGTGRATGLVA